MSLKLGNSSVKTPYSKMYVGDTLVYTSEAPTPYTEVSYLESTGTQYLITPVTMSANYDFEIEFQYNDNSVAGYIGGNGYQGTRRVVGGMRFYCPETTVGYFYYAKYGLASLARQFVAYTDLLKHKLSFINNALYFDDTLVTDLTGTSFQYGTDRTFYLFTTPTNNTTTDIQTIALARIYSFSVTDNTTNNKVLDLIPVLDSENVPCMYDKVSGTFLYNQGTGVFNYGI